MTDPIKCAFCTHITPHMVDGGALQCTVCRFVTWEGITWPQVVSRRRTVLNISRREMARLTGFCIETIARCEHERCSEAYVTATGVLINDHFLKQPQ